MRDTTPDVRERAYLLWEKAGMPAGREHEFWAQATREIEGEHELLHKNADGVFIPARPTADVPSDS